jgi:hypothetical protein
LPYSNPCWQRRQIGQAAELPDLDAQRATKPLLALGLRMKGLADFQCNTRAVSLEPADMPRVYFW